MLGYLLLEQPTSFLPNMLRNDMRDYLTLRSISSLNNPQNREVKIRSSHVENHHNYHRLHSE